MAQKSQPASTEVQTTIDATATGTPEMTIERRDEMAAHLVTEWALWSGAAGLIPLPVVDTLAVGGVQLHMLGGALAGPVTAFLYDWNMLPIGQQLWLKELESYVTYPPLQAPETYNLSGILAEVKKAHANHPGD